MMISTPAAHKVKSGNIMSFFYLPDWNPSGPKAPCESGYIYIDPIGPVAGKVPNPGPNGLTVFYRVDLSPARWLYMGQYKVLKFNPMSGAEWATLPEKVLLRIHPSDFKANSDSHIQLRKKWLVLLKLKPWAHTLDRIAELLPEGKAFLQAEAEAEAKVAKLATELEAAKGKTGPEHDQSEIDELTTRLKAAKRKVTEFEPAKFEAFNRMMCEGFEASAILWHLYFLP